MIRCTEVSIYLFHYETCRQEWMLFDLRDNMDSSMRRPASIPTLEPVHPRRRRPHHDRIRPVSRVERLNEDDIAACDTRQEEIQQHTQPQPNHRTSNGSHRRFYPSDSNSNQAERIQSPLYQTIIPAFNPNHYDIGSTNVCLCIPVTIKTPLNKWRQRRRSVKDLRARDEEMRNEYARLKNIETEFRGDLPPYEEARKNGIHVRNEGVERPQTAAVPQFGLNQGGIANGK